MQTVTVFACLLLTVVFGQVQSFKEDLLKTFFETKNPNDLHPHAQQFILLWGNQQRAANGGHWCCAITPPSIPVFSNTGHLLHYQPQPCPDTHMVCCKGFINIQAQCFSFDEIKDILPAWQTLFEVFGSSMTVEQILNAVHQVG